MDRVRSKSAQFVLDLWDDHEGAFRFTHSKAASVMATAYCVLALEALGDNAALGSKAPRLIAFLRLGQRPDGTFFDPTFRFEERLSLGHDRSYFDEETTVFCRQALDALGAGSPLRIPAEAMDTWAWQDPWLDANRAHFYMAQLAQNAVRHQHEASLTALDRALSWVESRHDPRTGFWKIQGPSVSPQNVMAATSHFIPFWEFRQKPIPYAERMIDSCLSLQGNDGLFGQDTVGHSCWDFDALEILRAASRQTEHRRRAVTDAAAKARQALTALQNPDGGFAHTFFRKRFVAGIALPQVMNKKAVGDYQCGRASLSSRENESNAYTTWFRILALRAASAEGFPDAGRSLPFLGYRPEGAV